MQALLVKQARQVQQVQQEQQVQLVMAGKPPTLDMLGLARSSVKPVEPERRVWLEDAAPTGNSEQIESMLADESTPVTSASGQRSFRIPVMVPVPQPRSNTVSGESICMRAMRSRAGLRRSLP